MSICLSGINSKSNLAPITIKVTEKHPLVKLAEAISWEHLYEIAALDLAASTPKKMFTRGRKLKIRIHLAVYLLQKHYNMKDRQTEWTIQNNAAFQIFCGFGIVDKWHCPDHTKIEEFRSRLTPETQRDIANFMAKTAINLGFADPSKMDIDSTIQEPNMAFPSDANLLVKLGGLAKKVMSYIADKLPPSKGETIKVDMKSIKAKAKTYLFMKQKKDSTVKKDALLELHKTVSIELSKVTQIFLTKLCVQRLPWNIKRSWEQLQRHTTKFLKDSMFFIEENSRVKDKALSFHLSEVAFFNKDKANKKTQFGRAYQLGRIGGNFMIAGKCDTIRVEDKHSVESMIEEHKELFGEDCLESFGADKGYFSGKNLKYLKNLPYLKEHALQKPGLDIASLPEAEKDTQIRLMNRRSGIEPLIGHIKNGGQLRRSRMKSDKTTLASGYSSVTGHNTRQLMRHLLGKKIKAM